MSKSQAVRAYFEKLGDTIQLVYRSRKNKTAAIQLDGDNLYTKINNNTVTTLTEDGLAVTGTTSISGTLTTSGNIVAENISLQSGVVEKTALVTLTATQIVGTAAGDVGHASGATLVASPGSDYVLELVSAILIYDYLTGAYTGGGDDTVIQLGTVAQTAAIAGADLLEASGDKIVMVTPLAAVDLPMTVGTTLNLQGTALTAGTGAGVLRCHITYRIHTTGL